VVASDGPIILSMTLWMVLAQVLEADADIVSGDIFNIGDERINHQFISLQSLCWTSFRMSPCTISRTILTSGPTIWDSAKIKQRLGFVAKETVHHGIVETKEAVEHGLVKGGDPTAVWYSGTSR
jgi:hypothetical protein